MKCNVLIALLWALLAAPAFEVGAKTKTDAISDADATAMRGKTVAITLHERPDFTAMAPGKVMTGLIGAFSMTATGNKLVSSNNVQDPARILREQLANALRDTYGALPQAVDDVETKSTRADELAKLHPQSDYILSVKTLGWSYAYFPTAFNRYWTHYLVETRLVDSRSGRLVSKGVCATHTRPNPIRPSIEQLHANQAQLLKDMLDASAWFCAREIAQKGFRVPGDKLPVVPAALVDPLRTTLGMDAGLDASGDVNKEPAVVTPAAKTTDSTANEPDDPSEPPPLRPAGDH